MYMSAVRQVGSAKKIAFVGRFGGQCRSSDQQMNQFKDHDELMIPRENFALLVKDLVIGF